MSIKIKEWHYRRCKGIIQTFLARGEDKMPFTKVLKTLQTALRKRQISQKKLQTMLSEAEGETVEAFLNTHLYQSRRKRLDELRKGLGESTV